jgi:nucleoside diphosphate kinase
MVLRPYEPTAVGGMNEPILFLKPEATDRSVDLPGVLGVVDQALGAFGVEIGGVAVLGGQYLGRHGLIDQHYGVINDVSRRAASALSPAALATIVEKYAVPSQDDLIGGHQALERYSCFNAESLNILWENLNNTKMASGTYCAPVLLAGRRYVLVNGFHPFQVEYFTRKGVVLVVFSLRTVTAWRTLRASMTGATNPVKAEMGSIRRTLLDTATDLGIARISQGYNGVHLSAGPFEAMAETVRYFSDYSADRIISATKTSLGHFLAARGLSAASIQKLTGNVLAPTPAGPRALWDETEDLDTATASELVLSSRHQWGI